MGEPLLKTQEIRLADVFFIGPLMIWGGLQLQDRHPMRGLTLAALGVATILYNYRNYELHASGADEAP